MARTSMEALEHKIERAQEQVSRTRKQYDAAIAALSDLLDKRDALKRDELVKAIMKSDKTYDEVLAFLGGGTEEKKNGVNANVRRGRKAKRTDR
ncbi:MAG: hypothetical protein K6E53_16260 [Lachnospiraceae bacterium]|nr:hypothetical protein [Lachnospiraceae bacterium]